MAPQTSFSAIADEISEVADQNNRQLPVPSATERRRLPMQQASVSQTSLADSVKQPPFRMPEPPKVEENKKRKLPVTTENSSLAQHLLGPSKISRIQQLYR